METSLLGELVAANPGIASSLQLLLERATQVTEPETPETIDERVEPATRVTGGVETPAEIIKRRKAMLGPEWWRYVGDPSVTRAEPDHEVLREALDRRAAMRSHAGPEPTGSLEGLQPRRSAPQPMSVTAGMVTPHRSRSRLVVLGVAVLGLISVVTAIVVIVTTGGHSPLPPEPSLPLEPSGPISETVDAAIRLVGKFLIVLLALIVSGCLLAMTVKLFAKLWRVVSAVVDPLPAIAAPDAGSARPMSELQNLAARSVLRLRAAYRLQLALSIGVAVTIGAAFVWSLVMVTVRRLSYATAFGTGGLGATVLAMRWQPFDRVVRARDLAEQADVLATGLRLRMTTIAFIEDPLTRHNEEWKAVKEYTAEALGARQTEAREAAAAEAREVAATEASQRAPRTKRPRRPKASAAARTPSR